MWGVLLQPVRISGGVVTKGQAADVMAIFSSFVVHSSDIVMA